MPAVSRNLQSGQIQVEIQWYLVTVNDWDTSGPGSHCHGPSHSAQATTWWVMPVGGPWPSRRSLPVWPGRHGRPGTRPGRLDCGRLSEARAAAAVPRAATVGPGSQRWVNCVDVTVAVTRRTPATVSAWVTPAAAQARPVAQWRGPWTISKVTVGVCRIHNIWICPYSAYWFRGLHTSIILHIVHIALHHSYHIYKYAAICKIIYKIIVTCPYFAYSAYCNMQNM